MPAADPSRSVMCKKLGKELPALLRAPFPTELGAWIHENISKEAWDLWLQESVRYINTYKVDLATKSGTQLITAQLRIWLGLDDGEMLQTAWVPPPADE